MESVLFLTVQAAAPQTCLSNIAFARGVTVCFAANHFLAFFFLSSNVSTARLQNSTRASIT
ncbi:hypothetical protein PF011_g22221 [Phytophthora fragariae]|uniref:Uncharacterized protein n=2 Tax=Phytophthora TaxID=4783 RepID=A0A6A3ID47_9STRA|nr:hypothetical protein PF011_g22221 [Phytophthora fragariae]KAE8990098.1 hypothetical protein PR002_g21254 [Phytophthora rubi]KAE9308953.1 hypothetical protein PF008_g20834 [Phytophthora fragariae]